MEELILTLALTIVRGFVKNPAHVQQYDKILGDIVTAITTAQAEAKNVQS